MKSVIRLSYFTFNSPKSQTKQNRTSEKKMSQSRLLDSL